MSLEAQAAYWRAKLREGKPIYRVRVKRLLAIAGSERRGSVISDRIRQTLTNYGLRTEPDFVGVWPDSLVAIELIDFSHADVTMTAQDDAVQTSEELLLQNPALELVLDIDSVIPPVAPPLEIPTNNTTLPEKAVSPSVDAVIRISTIASANRGVLTVSLSDSVRVASTQMMFHGYSQLAIMQNEREVRGMITWESIASQSLLKPTPTIADCLIEPQLISADGSIFDAIAIIDKHGYVLVRSRDRKVTGIVTASDLAIELASLSYAFMCIRTIEVLIRSKLHPCLAVGDFDQLEQHSRAKGEQDFSLLTFGENVRLLELPAIWNRLNINIDRSFLIPKLLVVRDIRNDVMHFEPEQLDQARRQQLQEVEQFLRRVFI